MRRREFLERLGVALAGAGGVRRAAGGNLAWPARRLQRIGLELYSVRNEMRRDPERTLAAVRAIGYTDVELLWSWGNFGRTTAQVRAALDREGLSAPSCHLAPEALLADWDRSLGTARELGQQYLIVPSLPAETRTSLDAWRRWADHFNRAGEAARGAGLWLAFHNEPDHMRAIEGRVPYDVFLERTEPRYVRLQLDTGNMVMGGGDPLLYLQRHHDRFWSFHLKDVAQDRSRDTDLGTGRVDFRSLLGAVRDLEAKPCFVEQEGAADPLASAGRDFAYLKALDF